MRKLLARLMWWSNIPALIGGAVLLGLVLAGLGAAWLVGVLL